MKCLYSYSELSSLNIFTDKTENSFNKHLPWRCRIITKFLVLVAEPHHEGSLVVSTVREELLGLGPGHDPRGPGAGHLPVARGRVPARAREDRAHVRIGIESKD